MQHAANALLGFLFAALVSSAAYFPSCMEAMADTSTNSSATVSSASSNSQDDTGKEATESFSGGAVGSASSKISISDKISDAGFDQHSADTPGAKGENAGADSGVNVDGVAGSNEQTTEVQPEHPSLIPGWNKIDALWYFYSADGSAMKGWLHDGGSSYYFDPATGAMKTGWVAIDGQRYFFDNSGAMRTGWLKDGGSWYYLDESGAMITSWRYVAGSWYYLDPASGAMKTGWVQDGGAWYYLDGSGAMATGWRHVNGSWYWFWGSGAMQGPGWAWVNGSWYYFLDYGGMATGWVKDNGTWYYLYGSGAMAHDAWVGNYYLTGSGAWDPNAYDRFTSWAQGYSSSTNYLVMVDLSRSQVAVFYGWRGNWSKVRQFYCCPGTPSTPTQPGIFTLKYHLAHLRSYPNARYATNISGGYFFHSILRSNAELGQHLSHGCIRLAIPDAQYIQSLPYGSKVVIW